MDAIYGNLDWFGRRAPAQRDLALPCGFFLFLLFGEEV